MAAVRQGTMSQLARLHVGMSGMQERQPSESMSHRAFLQGITERGIPGENPKGERQYVAIRGVPEG